MSKKEQAIIIKTQYIMKNFNFNQDSLRRGLDTPPCELRTLKNTKTHPLWRYAAMITLLLTLACGQMWGETLSFSITSPSNKSTTQNNITVASGNDIASKTFNGVSSTAVYKIDSKVVTITSTTQNITKLVFEACYNSSGTVKQSCKVTVSDDGTNFYPLGTGVYVAGATGTNSSSTAGIYIAGNTSKTEVTVTFYGAHKYIKIEKDGQETWINVIKVYTESVQTISWANGGHGTAPTSPTSTAGIIAPKLFADGYKHIGWKADQTTNVNGSSTASNTLISVGAGIQFSAGTTLTAQWSEVECPAGGEELFKITMKKVSTKKSLVAYEEVDLSTYATVTTSTGEAYFSNTGVAKGEVYNADPGYLSYNDNGVFTRIELYCALQTGDQISFTAATGTNQIALTTTPERSTTYSSTSGSYTLPSAFNGSHVLYIWRYSSSSPNIKELTITRVAAASGYTVTYANGGATSGSVPEDASSPYAADDVVTILGNTGSLAKTGYTFAGWSANVNLTIDEETVTAGTTIAAGKTFPMPESNVTLTAVWTALQDKFQDKEHGSEEGHGGSSGLTRSGGNATTPNFTDFTPVNDYCNDLHYHFIGWVISTSVNDDGTLKNDAVIVPGGQGSWNCTGATYYAVWAAENE